MKKYFLLFPLITLFSSLVFAQKQDIPKLSADEVINKHLESLGSTDARAAIKSRVLAGTGIFNVKLRPEKVGGPVQFASVDDKLLLAFVFNANNYPYEKVGFDGKDLTVTTLPGGGLSPLGGFLKSSKFVLKRGLFGGVLSQSWALANRDKESRFEAAGTTKINDRPAYKVKYSTSGIGDMSVLLYFDAETFYHVRTEYFYRTGQLTSPNPDSRSGGLIGGAAPSNFTLTEDFSNFAKANDIVLPMTYIIEYSSNAGKPWVWTANFTQVFNNQEIEPAAFRVS